MSISAKQVGQLFRLHGLSLRPDALKAIVGTANQSIEPMELARLIVEQVRAQPSADRIVDGRRIASALDALRGQAEGKPYAGRVLEVIDAFDTPKLRYDDAQRAYSAGPVSRSMHSGADAQRELYAGRYALVRQRLLRNALFKRPALEHLSKSANYLQLTDVEALQGTIGQQCVLGLLCEPAEGTYHLEDMTGSVPLDLTHCEVKAGIFTLGCLVLVEGEYTLTGVFEAKVLCFPPPEPRERTRALLEGLPAFGVNDSTNSDKVRAELLARSQNAMMVVISDCWLDRSDVLSALDQLLGGYEGLAAGFEDAEMAGDLAFVFCGNFTSEALACTEMGAMRALFDTLGEMIAARPTLAKHAHFVLLPGPKDLLLGPNEALPRSRLPAVFTRKLQASASNVHFASSPARLRFFGRELVLFRDELVIHMRRNAIVEPNLSLAADLTKHVSPGPKPAAPLCVLSRQQRARRTGLPCAAGAPYQGWAMCIATRPPALRASHLQ